MFEVKSKVWIAALLSVLIISPLNLMASSSSSNEFSAKINPTTIAIKNNAAVDAFDKLPTEELSGLVKYLHEKGYNIEPLLEDPRFEIYKQIADRFRKSAEKKSHTLTSYKRVLGFEAKASQIQSFLQEHNDQLSKAENTYGISKFIIAAIIGIESDFGQNIGSYNPFNAYVSMYANGYRQEFAKAQLAELMEFVNRKNIDVFELKSSYAGAMAFAQFIPYSLNKWFVGDDIFSMDNNIMSVGNYLAYFKERTGDIETAVMRYNPSQLYTDAVLDLAESARKQNKTK